MFTLNELIAVYVVGYLTCLVTVLAGAWRDKMERMLFNARDKYHQHRYERFKGRNTASETEDSTNRENEKAC